MTDPYRDMPDVRDGLTRLERAILVTLRRLEAERPGRSIPTLQLYGRVVELVDCSPEAFQAVLNRMVDRPNSGDPGL